MYVYVMVDAAARGKASKQAADASKQAHGKQAKQPRYILRSKNERIAE